MDARNGPLPLLSLNHVSRVCTDLEASYRFYSEVLGFLPVKRPTSFEFEGAWLFNYGIGLHLIKGSPPTRPSKVEPKSCHISFQTSSLEEVERGLVARGIDYVKNVFVEDGLQIGQLFFHDPDNNMIEVCNCDQLPVVILSEAALACAARPPLAAVTTQPQQFSLPLPVPVPHPSAVPTYDADADDSAGSTASTASVCAAASSEAASSETASTGRRSHSFSNSSVFGAAAGLDVSALSLHGSELDDWPMTRGGGSVCGGASRNACGEDALSGGLGGCAGVSGDAQFRLQERKGGPVGGDGAAGVVNIHAVAASCDGRAASA